MPEEKLPNLPNTCSDPSEAQICESVHPSMPSMLPGIAACAISAVASLAVLVQIETSDLYTNFYPEALLIPAFLYWIFAQYRVHRALQGLTDGTHPVGPIKAAVSFLFAGPVAIFLAGYILAAVSGLLSFIFNAGSDAYQSFMKSGGLLLIVGSILMSYVGAAVFTMIIVMRIYGALSKLAVSCGLKRDFIQPWLVTTSLVCPALWATVNIKGSYSEFLIAVVWQSVALLLCMISLRNTCSRIANAIAAVRSPHLIAPANQAERRHVSNQPEPTNDKNQAGIESQ